MARLYLSFLFLLLVSCSSPTLTGGTISGGSNNGGDSGGGDNATDNVLIPFLVSPDNFSFPRTELGAVSLVTVKITNITDNNLFIKNGTFLQPISITNTSLSTACNSTGVFIKLAPKQSCFIDAVFQPKIDTFLRDTLSITYYTDKDESQSVSGIAYSTRSLSAVGNEIIISTPEYQTFVNATDDKSLKSFEVFNNGDTGYLISATVGLLADRFGIDGSSSCGGLLQAGEKCRYDIIFNLPPDNDNSVYEGSITITAVNPSDNKGVSLKKPLVGNRKIDNIISLAFDAHTFNPTKVNNVNIDTKAVTLRSTEKIISFSKSFLKPSSIAFDNSSFDIDFINCRAGIEADRSCEIILKFKPLFAMRYEAIGKITARGESGKTYESYIKLDGSGVEDLSSDTTISGLEVSKLTSNLITEAGGSRSDTILFKNVGNNQLSLQFSHTNNSEFTITGCIGVVLTKGDSCTAMITFSPKAVGSYEDIMTVSAVGYSDKIDIHLSGISTAPTQTLDKITYSEKLINFGGIESGKVSSKISLQLMAKEDLSSLSYELSNSSNFNIESNSCGKFLKKGANCIIALSFSPTAELEYRAVIKVNNGGLSDIVELQGLGKKSSSSINILGLYLSTKTLPFPNTYINEFSPKREIIVKNISSSDIPLAYRTREEDNATMFNITSDCSYLIKAGSECKITIFFMPISSTSYSDDIILSSGGAEDRILLTGRGVSPAITDSFETAIDNLTISKKRVDFIKTEVGTRSVSATFELIYGANSGNDLLYELVNNEPAIFQIDSKGTTCNFVMRANQPTEQRCTVVLVFTPQSGSEYNDILSINDIMSRDKKAKVYLSGNGIEFMKSDNFGVVPVGSPAKSSRVIFVNDSNFSYDLKDVSVTTRVSDGLKNVLGSSGFSIQSTACSNVKLLPGKSCETIIVFDPKIDTETGAGYQGKLTIKSTDSDFNLQLLGATKNNTILKLESWGAGAPTYGWGTKIASINNKIYSVGNEFLPNHKQLREYNTATNSWKIITPIGTSPYEDTDKIFPIGRSDGQAKRSTKEYRFLSHTAILSSGDKFYVFGGWFNPSGSGYSGGFSSNILSYYNQADTRLNKSGSWTKLQSLPEVLFPQPGRHGQSIALINNRVYAYSGRDIGSIARADFLVYDIPTSTWSNITASISGSVPTPASFTAVLGYDSKLYVDGGNNSTTFFNEFWIFDTAKITPTNPNGTWFKVLNTSTETRYIHSIVEINGVLYIGGGKTNNKIYRFNTKDTSESGYGSWLTSVSPVGYLSDKTTNSTDNKDSGMVKIQDCIWINYGTELWVYFP